MIHYNVLKYWLTFNLLVQRETTQVSLYKGRLVHPVIFNIFMKLKIYYSWHNWYHREDLWFILYLVTAFNMTTILGDWYHYNILHCYGTTHSISFRFDLVKMLMQPIYNNMSVTVYNGSPYYFEEEMRVSPRKTLT